MPSAPKVLSRPLYLPHPDRNDLEFVPAGEPVPEWAKDLVDPKYLVKASEFTLDPVEE